MNKSAVRKRTDALTVFCYVAIIVLFIIELLPSLYGLITSVKVEEDVLISAASLIPKRITFDNYIKVFSDTTNIPVVRWFFNSMSIAILYVLSYVLVTSLAAYGFARLKFKGSEIIFWICMLSMMVPGVINMIPNYVMIYKLGLVNNKLAMILPGLSGVFGVFLLRQFMMGIPKEYDEAAKIDGASKLRIYAKIILPMCLPVLVTLSIFSFQGNWNDYLWPLMVTSETDAYTITAGLRNVSDYYSAQYGKQMALAMANALPVLLIFLFGQKYFIKGIAVGGVKG